MCGLLYDWWLLWSIIIGYYANNSSQTRIKLQKNGGNLVDTKGIEMTRKGTFTTTQQHDKHGSPYHNCTACFNSTVKHFWTWGFFNQSIRLGHLPPISSKLLPKGLLANKPSQVPWTNYRFYRLFNICASGKMPIIMSSTYISTFPGRRARRILLTGKI